MKRITSTPLRILPVAIFLVSLGIFGSVPTCVDPAGCLWLHPGEPLRIAIANSTGGVTLSSSLAVQLGAKQAAALLPPLDGHAIEIQNFFSPCLPEMTGQSNIDLSAEERTLAILGPICGEGIADFNQRLSAASYAVLSPIAFGQTGEETTISFTPNIRLLAQQAADLILGLAPTTLTTLADADPNSQTFRENFCSALEFRNLPCAEVTTGQNPTSENDSDLIVWISLQSTGELPDALRLGLPPSQPTLAISLSPWVGNVLQAPFTYWIGPSFFGHDEQPQTDFAGLLAYDSTYLIHQAALQTAQRLWDGSWLIPRQAFRARLAQVATQTGLYQYTCRDQQLNCLPLPLSLYQWAGMDYKLINR